MEKEPEKGLEYSSIQESKKEAELTLEEIRQEIYDFSKELIKVQGELLDYRKLREEIEALSKEPEDTDSLIKTLLESIAFLEEQIGKFRIEEDDVKKYIQKFDDLDRKLKELLLKAKTSGEH